MSLEIRAGLRPGDIGQITRLHGEVYAAEYGLGGIEPSVAETLGGLARRGWPGDREGIWMVEAGGEGVGSVILYDRGAGLARLGMLVLRPEHRGGGLGRRLVERCLEGARSAGYEQVELVTLPELRAAIHLYREAGFRRVGLGPQQHWGREITLERWTLDLRAGGSGRNVP
jgi:ribosomal protein S18 acetylase RimI-like enzyme